MYFEKHATRHLGFIVSTCVLLGALTFGCGSAKAGEYTIVAATETTPEMQCMSNLQYQPNPNYRDPMRSPLGVLRGLVRVAAPVTAAREAPVAMRAVSGGISGGMDASDQLARDAKPNTTDREILVDAPICHTTGRTLASIAADKAANQKANDDRVALQDQGNLMTKELAEKLMDNPRMWHPLAPGGRMGVWTGIDGRQYAGSRYDWDNYQASIGYK